MTASLVPSLVPAPRGRRSGNVAWIAGSVALGTVLCVRFPALFTSPEVRALYPLARVRLALTPAVAVACIASVTALVRGRKRGALGAGLVAAALLAGGVFVHVGRARGLEGVLSLDWLLVDLLLLALIFLPLERLRPLHPQRTRGRRTDAVYFAVNHLGLHGLTIAASWIAAMLVTRAAGSASFEALQARVSHAPLWVQIPAILLLADLVEYAVHRAMHEVPWLWRIHAIHHSSERMDALAGSRVHLIETLLMRSAVYLAVHLLGFAFPAALGYGAVITVQATLIHANVRLSYGPLDRFLVSPRVHHVHHASDAEAIDTNYAGTFAFLDLLFGTLYLPPNAGWPRRYGVVKEQIPDGFLAAHLFPFRSRARRMGRSAPTPTLPRRTGEGAQ